MRWGNRRHPNQSKKWVKNKYWHSIDGNNWRFACNKDDTKYVLPMHFETKIVRHNKVKGNASPYDGNLLYWATRMGQYPEVKNSMAILLKKQKGKCNLCHSNATTLLPVKRAVINTKIIFSCYTDTAMTKRPNRI